MEQLSHCGRYEAPTQLVPAPLPRQGDYGAPARPYPQVHLAQMQVFQGDGTVILDMFSDQVHELSRFYHWDEQETYRQACAHLNGTMLAYFWCAPFPPRTWEELKALRMKRFQPRDLTATYKGHLRSRCRRQWRISTPM